MPRDELVGSRAAQLDLAHVVDVEQSHRAAAQQVLLDCARRIGDGHVIAGEGRHLRAPSQMPVVELRS